MGTLATLRTAAKLYADENSLGSQWTDAEWNIFLNFAYQELYNKVANLDQQGFFQTSATLNWVSGTREYALPTGCSRVVRLERVVNSGTGNYVIPIITQPEKDFYEGGVGAPYRNNLGQLVAYLVGSSVGFMPTPGVTETGAVRVYYIPDLTELSASGDTPTIPTDCHEIIAVGAAIRAKMQKDLEVGALSSLYTLLYTTLVSTIHARNQANERYVNMTRLGE